MRDNPHVSHLRGFTLLVVIVLASIGIGIGALVATGTTHVSSGRTVKVLYSLAPLSGPLSLVTTTQPPNGDGTVQLVRLVGAQEIAVGPPLVSFQWNSGTHPVVARAPGVLWFYEQGLPLSPPTVWRISDSSGTVLQKTSVPPLTRPLLAADATGLYLAAGSFGGIGHSLIFHVGVGATSAVTVLGTGSTPASAEFAMSLTAGHGKVEAVVCTRPLGPPCPTEVIAEHS